MANKLPPERWTKIPATRQISKKQKEILNIVARGNPDGTPVTRQQVLERVTYETNLNSVWFIMRYIMGKKFIEPYELMRVGEARSNRTFIITPLGRHYISSGNTAEGEIISATEKHSPL